MISRASRIQRLAVFALAAMAAGLAVGAGQAAQPGSGAPVLPLLVVRSPNTVITQSCRVAIPPGLILRDTNGQGVIEVGAPNIELDFTAESVLRGSPAGTPPDQYSGYGIRLKNHAGVIIRGARISGFWCGLYATRADGLVLEKIDASDNRRDHLRSTPAAEDSSDWLYGHNNDHHEWLKKYGAALYVEDSSGVTVRDSRVWHGQNALCLDRVTASKIYDNDFSFNSGWGIALWRCSSNVVSRNALDFCVRGYSDGVYNRGQDSAGIFAFEQNNDNVFAENSVTHGGDGFFGFAGREALGQVGHHPPDWYRRRGNDDNLLIGNDFSDAAAHGIENTFSFGNAYLKNRIVGNAICGIWAGYSRQTLIAGNDIESNGERGYGLERGGVNIDHGGDNRIVHNFFARNQCGVHLWGGDNPSFNGTPWARANGYASTGSIIAGNTFEGDDLAFQFRGPGQVVLGANRLNHVGTNLLAEPAYHVIRDAQQKLEPLRLPAYPVYGRTHPVGQRRELQGRRNIIMTEWGPWDHAAPLVRLLKAGGPSALYQVLKVPAAEVQIETTGDQVRASLSPEAGEPDESQIRVSAVQAGAHPYVLQVRTNGTLLAQMNGTLLAAHWQATFFKWPPQKDPRKDLRAYRKLARGPSAITVPLESLWLDYGTRGPGEMGLSDRLARAGLGHDHFGMIARTRLRLTRGAWKFSTLSDDGVRVRVDGRPVIDDWTWHIPTRDVGSLTLNADRTVEIVVEHFQIDGNAALEFSLSRQPDSAPAQVR